MAARRRRPTSVEGVSEYVLNGPDVQLDLPSPPQMGNPAEVSKLLATTGAVALDEGFVNTAACTSAITYIDGNAGILRYRGLSHRTTR